MIPEYRQTGGQERVTVYLSARNHILNNLIL